jgi:hypothetical protein
MRMFPKMVARVSVIPWLGSFALNSVLNAVHRFPINKKADATESRDFEILSRRLTL